MGQLTRARYLQAQSLTHPTEKNICYSYSLRQELKDEQTVQEHNVVGIINQVVQKGSQSNVEAIAIIYHTLAAYFLFVLPSFNHLQK